MPTARGCPRPRASDVRVFDDSQGLVCHMTFHSWLRSSSMPEPRRPPRRFLWTGLRLLGRGPLGLPHPGATTACRPAPFVLVRYVRCRRMPPRGASGPGQAIPPEGDPPLPGSVLGRLAARSAGCCCRCCAGRASAQPPPRGRQVRARVSARQTTDRRLWVSRPGPARRAEAHTGGRADNDPSAGSPTETLLRLLLPLDAGARGASGRAQGTSSGQLAATSNR